MPSCLLATEPARTCHWRRSSPFRIAWLFAIARNTVHCMLRRRCTVLPLSCSVRSSVWEKKLPVLFELVRIVSVLVWSSMLQTYPLVGWFGMIFDLLSCVQAGLRCWSIASRNRRCYGKVGIRIRDFLIIFHSSSTIYVARTVSRFGGMIFEIH